MSKERGFEIRYPLRDDFDAVLILPRDLTAAEAARIKRFILSIVTDTEWHMKEDAGR